MSPSSLTNKSLLNNMSRFKDSFQTSPSLKFPVSRKLNADCGESATVEFILNDDLRQSLTALAEEQNMTLPMLLLAAFQVLLQRYSGQEDHFLTQLIPRNAGQETSGDLVTGFRIVKSMFNGSVSFMDVLRQFKTMPAGTPETDHLTVDDLSSFLKSLESGAEIFRVFFSFADETLAGAFPGMDTAWIPNTIFRHFKDFYLGLSFIDTPVGIHGTLCYNTSFFEPAFISKFQQHWINLLASIVKNPQEVIGNYQILTDQEWQELIVDFNNTITPYPEEKLLYSFFEDQAAAIPDAVALISGKSTLTYGQLNKQSNRLAHYLIEQGIRPGDNIGLLVERNFDMIIGMLGILKAGGAYVPIDPDYPIERQEYIFNQSALKLVIADKSYPLKSLIAPGKFLDTDFSKISLNRETNPALLIDSTQLAYTIYTSGSTGRPKGVMIRHHSAVNLILWVNQQFHIGSGDRMLFITSMCFDLSVYDIFGILSAGGQIVIARQNEIQNIKQLQSMLIDHAITFWDSVPTTLDYLISNLETEEPSYQCHTLRTIFLSGDWIPLSLPERLKKYMPQTRVISLGGATEGTVWSNFYPVEKTAAHWNSIPYGKPIFNNFFYILNKQLQPVPVGVLGDLYIGGCGVALGYANDPDKTGTAFIPDPFHQELGGMMYRTGDLGRMMPDGNMEFIGREDNQVKIQGFRIELGEIESILKSFHLLSNAVVLAKDDHEGKKRLIGYIVPESGSFNKDLVIAYLRTKLPGYMVPQVWIEMQALPLTSNGKIDRNNLPAVNFSELNHTPYTSPCSKTETILKVIWQDCLGIPDIGVKANFFELGGHSLKAVQILSKFEKQTGKAFQIAIFFKYPDIQSLARFIDQEDQKPVFTSLVPIKPSGNKHPLYIIHGEGLNVLNFSDLAACIDKEQPIYGLQAKGLNGIDEPLESIPDIAAHYIDEILQHNPSGPYLLSGYSFGGYVAVEMNRQLVAMDRNVQMLIMFDTNAEKTEYKDWYQVLPQKVKRHLPKLLTFLKGSVTQPITTFRNQSNGIPKKELKKESEKFYQQIKKIKEKHLTAFRKYQLLPFDQKVYLFKAETCVHYVNDTEFLGWGKYARAGVEVLEVPGDHLSMLKAPNVEKLAAILEKTLNNTLHS